MNYTVVRTTVETETVVIAIPDGVDPDDYVTDKLTDELWASLDPDFDSTTVLTCEPIVDIAVQSNLE